VVSSWIDPFLTFLSCCFIKLDDSLVEVGSDTAQKVNGVTNGSTTSPQDSPELDKSSGSKPQASSSSTGKSASKTGKFCSLIILIDVKEPPVDSRIFSDINKLNFLDSLKEQDWLDVYNV